MNIIHDPEVQSLQQFLQRWPPSSTTAPSDSWIYVLNPAGHSATKKSEKDSVGLSKAWSSLCLSRNDAVSCTDLHALAVEYSVLGGKWMIFPDSASVDMDWSKVAEGVTSGILGTLADVSTKNQDNDGHVICVFTKNYLDVDDVKRVREGLRSLGFTKQLKYKPDAFTECGVFAKNKWRIPASCYSA